MNGKTRSPQATTPGSQSKGMRSRTLAVVARSLLATLFLSGAMGVGAYMLSDVASPLGDDVTQSDAQARLEAFHALPPLDLVPVAAGDVDKAIQGMHLDPAAAQALRADLDDANPSPQSTPDSQSLSPVQQQAPQPAAKPQQTRRRRLVWITLWDTDVEDGDVVRLDSQGYSRTVRLTKKGDTFAVPVPADGVIKVTGVSDGDGGGITVGLASGSERAIFPIMSEGQELGLKVRMN
ncbi:hypothetical protein [Dyella psychrodurans]|nr:hypothetical protein [Dyella psychrodurans]